MGRGKNMRIRARREYLGILAKQKPAQFDKEWAVRLESWAERARRRADNATAFSTVDDAVAELEACGVDRGNIYEETRTVLTDAACMAVSAVIDPRMHRLGNTANNCTKVREGLNSPR